MDKISFQCRNCKFKFSRKEEPLKCPYCDKGKTLIVLGEHPADDLVREASEF
ncbi:hypothetical protein HY486_01285 [Candidatus Woesearchaeota archaeon]|nr:hypothetical protein [Candidatus Woesearchaeota archaeon]